MHTLRKLFQLSAPELWALVQAAVLLPAVPLALRFVTIARLQTTFGSSARFLRDSAPPKLSQLRNAAAGASVVDTTAKAGLSPQTTSRLVRVAAERGLYRARCLEKSLVLCWLLQRQGVEARILFGARKEEEQMQAHAWVEVDGVALNEDNGMHRHFAPFGELLAGN